MKLLFFWLAALLLISSSLLAQNTTALRGKVIDEEGKPVPFVSVVLAGTTWGVATDDNGTFHLKEIPLGNYVLEASFVGYKTLRQSIALQKEQVYNLDLALIEEATLLREIVVKAYTTPNERVASIGKLPIRTMDLPISLLTVDRATLESQQVNSLQDVLMNTPGVYVSGATGGYQEEISGRGFAYGSSNTFKNGVRFINSMTPELSSLERVEVLKGSAAFLYGNVAAGGVLNLVTKKPRSGFGGEVSLRSGSFGLIKPIFDVYGSIDPGDKIRFRLNGTYQKANSFRQFVQSERAYINPSLQFTLGKNTELLLEADYLADERTPDFGTGILNYTLIPEYPRNRFLGVPWGSMRSKQASSAVTLTHTFSSNWRWTFQAAWRNTEQALFSAARPNTGSLIKSDGTWVRNIQKSESYDSYLVMQNDLSGSFSTGKLKHTVLAGFDTDHFTQKTQQYAQFARYDTINILEDLPSDSRTDQPAMKLANLSTNPTSRYGFYVQDLIDLNPQFKLLAGVRYSSQQTESRVTTPDGITAPPTSSQDAAFSPRLGLVYQPLSHHTAFLSYSNSFVLNTGVDVAGKPLPPSLIDQYEVGVKNELFKQLLTLNMTTYRIDHDNLAQISLENGNTNSNIKELSGAVRSQGVELDLAARPSPVLSLTLGYSYNQTKYIRSNTYLVGSLLRYNPAHTAHASIRYDIEKGSLKGLQVGLVSSYIGTRYAGRSTRVQVPNDTYRITELPDYVQIDLNASYSRQSWYLRARLANVFNALSWNAHDDNSINPIAPRNYSIVMGWRF